jgi:hypothetical protein
MVKALEATKHNMQHLGYDSSQSLEDSTMKTSDDIRSDPRYVESRVKFQTLREGIPRHEANKVT